LEGEVFQNEVGAVTQRHQVMTDLLALALACDQTRVFNMMFSYGLSELRMEGSDTTLLDNCLVLANSDLSLAQPHDVRGLPMMIAGSAGGRIKPGIHVKGNTDPVTRVGLTVQQAMGLPIDAWGTNSLRTSLPVSEILV
jgi:hypothetical protein